MTEWLAQNWVTISIAATASVAAGAAIAKLTPTNRDDSFWDSVSALLKKAKAFKLDYK